MKVFGETVENNAIKVAKFNINLIKSKVKVLFQIKLFMNL